MKHFKRFVRNCKIGWIDKNTFGTYDYCNQEIKINKILAVVDIFIHEYLHHQYPDATERQIIKKTALKVNRMSKKDIIKLYTLIKEKCDEEED